MSVILLVFFMNGFQYYEQVSSLEECVAQGNELVQLGMIKYYQCAKVYKVGD